MGLLALVGPTQGVFIPPSGQITLVTATPINIPASSPAGTDICQLQLTAGLAGTGVWTIISSTFTKARLAEADGTTTAPINGTSVFLEVSTQLVPADAIDSASVVVQYTLAGLTPSPTIAVFFNVTSAITISQVTATPINIPANSVVGTDIAELKITTGAGTGEWTITGGFAKARLAEKTGGAIVAPINGTNVIIEVSQNLVAGDAVAATNVTVQYFGEGMLAPVAFTCTFNVTAVTQQSFAMIPDYALNYTALTGAGTITQRDDGVEIAAGTGTGDSQHMQILSKLGVARDFVMVVDITVLDSSAGTDDQESGLIYFQMTGDNSTGHPPNINNWTGTTGATRFELDATGYRMSFDPLPGGTNNFDQIRMRLCDAGDITLPIIIGTGDGNTQPGDFPFVTNHTYRCTIGKVGQIFNFAYEDLGEGTGNTSLFVQLPTFNAFDAGRTVVTDAMANVPGNAVFNGNDFTVTGTLKTLDLRGSVATVPEVTTVEQPTARLVNCGNGLIVAGMAATDNTRNDVITWRQRKTAPSQSWPEGNGIESDNDFVRPDSGASAIVFEGTYSKGHMDIFNPDPATQTGTMTLRTGYHKFVDDDFFVLIKNNQRIDCTDYLIEEMKTLVSMDGGASAILNMDHSIVHCGRCRYSQDPGGDAVTTGAKFTARYPGATLTTPKEDPGFACSKIFKECQNGTFAFNRVIFRQDSIGHGAPSTNDWPVSRITCTNCVFIYLGTSPYPGTLPSAGLEVLYVNSTKDGMLAYDWYLDQRRIWLQAHGATNKTIGNLGPTDFNFLKVP